MSNPKDFVINNNGILSKYNGPGGDIVIPDGVREIRGTLYFKSPFSGCTGLTSVSIPESVTEIGWSAFSGCTLLTNITLPETVTKIDWAAFKDCVSLNNISIPEATTYIGGYSFDGCSSMANIHIPEGVTEIGEYAFRSCSKMTSINIPESIQEIGEGAFGNCKNLSLVFEGSLLHFDLRDTFKDSDFCPIYAPKISLDAFGGTKAKKYVILGYLQHLEIEDTVSEERKKEYIKYIKSYKDTRFAAYDLAISNAPIMHFLTTYQLIPLKEYESFMEKVSNSDNIEIKSMLLEYWNNAFSTMQKVKHEEKQFSVHEPTISELKELWTIRNKADGTLEIGGYKGAELDISMPSSVGKSKVTSIGEYAFSPNASRMKNASTRLKINSVIIPEGVAKIGNSAFENCTSLISIYIPKKVSQIGSSAFSGCSSLTDISIPKSVSKIDEDTFRGCSSLTSIIIPESVKKFERGAFYKCTRLTSINIPDSVTEIGSHAFHGCSSLTSIIISESVKEIGYCTFMDCSSLSSITIPKGVNKISDYAFEGCCSMSSITIPESVREIDTRAFESCTSLTSINIPESVLEIGEDAFQNCKNLSLVLDGESVHCDLKHTFKNSDFLPIYAPKIPLSVFKSTEIRKYAILGYLKHLNFEDSLAAEQKTSYISYVKSHKDARFAAYEEAAGNKYAMGFLVSNKLIPLKEYDDLMETVSASGNSEIKAMLLEYWDTAFSAKQKVKHQEKQSENHQPTATELKTLWITKKKEDGTLEIGGYKGQDSDICIPVSVGKYEVTSIGEYAFSPGAPRVKNASIREAITSVMIPESVTEIGAYAFWGCSSLTSITLPKAVTKIGAYAFWDCGSLNSITIPDSVIEIGDWAFYNCSNLTDITIPESVKKFGEWPFCGCSSLIIHAPAGSYAATYAERHSIPFVAE